MAEAARPSAAESDRRVNFDFSEEEDRLRDLSRKRNCWQTDAEARKLQTKALMELGDFAGCMTAGQGLKDKEVEQWRKLCERRAG